MNKRNLIAQRPIKPEDYNFIMATWLRGLYYGNDWFREIDKDVYMKVYHDIIDTVLKKAQTRVSCLVEDPDTVLGYAVFENQTLHWVFVKHAWRKIGIAKDILPPNITATTHLTKIGKLLKPTEMVFNPFLL